MNYYMTKKVSGDFDGVKKQVVEALADQGFGVLTEIDMQATFKKKLDKTIYKYEILGACSPALAFEAVAAEDKIGTMLPCNVILQQKEESGPIEVSAIDPKTAMEAIGNDTLTGIAQKVSGKLATVLESI